MEQIPSGFSYILHYLQWSFRNRYKPPFQLLLEVMFQHFDDVVCHSLHFAPTLCSSFLFCLRSRNRAVACLIFSRRTASSNSDW